MTILKEHLVLLVAPDVETRTSLYSILDQEGYLVATSCPDAGALRYVAEHKPDVALVGRHPEDLPAEQLPLRIKVLSPRTRVLLFDPSQPWLRDSGRVQALVEALKKAI